MITLPSVRHPEYKFDRIAFVGPMCSGKTFMAKNLPVFNDPNDSSGHYQLLSFGTELKKVASTYFDVSGKDGEARRVYQWVGSALRNLDTNVWVKPVLNKIAADPASLWVVDDVRYINEAAALRDAGFVIITLFVPEEVRWQRIRSLYPTTLFTDSLHGSETEWKEIEPDYTLPSITEADVTLLHKLIETHDEEWRTISSGNWGMEDG